MEKKYIELSTENIKEYNDKCRDILSSNINRKKEYIMDGNRYNNNLNIINNDLSYTLKRIEELINEIRELSKRISILDRSKVSLAYNHNQLLSKNNINTNKINNARYYYNEIILELDRLIKRRDELKDILKWYKEKIIVLILRKKHFNKHINKCSKNVNVCNYNMNECYKVLDRLDNIYLNRSEKVTESYVTPKVKRIK